MPDEGRLLALLHGFGVDLGDEVDETHAREQGRVDGIVPVVGLGDHAQLLGVSEHEVTAGSLQQIVEPGPGRARFHDDLERTVSFQQLDEPGRLAVANAERLLDEPSVVAHDRNDHIRCVSVNSRDEHDGLLGGWLPRVR
jgi:hypothetical protein